MDRIYHVSFPGFGLEFEISPVAVTIGTFSVYWYGIIIAAAFLLGVFYCTRESKNHGVDGDKLMNCLIAGIVTAVIGARIYYVAFSWDSFRGDLKSIINIHGGGLAIYGGIIGALVGGLAAAKIQKMEILPLLDVVFPGFLLGQGIGRWGNFMNQEAFGTQTDVPWRMVSENTGGVGVHPCFLYESLWCLIGFAIVVFYLSKRQEFTGQLLYFYMIWYGFERMLVEGLRSDSLYLSFGHLRVSQLVSAVLFVSGIMLFAVNFAKYKKNEGKAKHAK